MYLPARKSLTTFAVITVMLIILTIINACVCTHNFNKGLKPHIARRKVDNRDNFGQNYQGNEQGNGQHEMPDYKHGPVPSRMLIDWGVVEYFT